MDIVFVDLEEMVRTKQHLITISVSGSEPMESARIPLPGVVCCLACEAVSGRDSS